MFYVKKTRKEKNSKPVDKKSVFVFISGVYILYLGCQIYAISLRNNANLCPSKNELICTTSKISIQLFTRILYFFSNKCQIKILSMS